MNAPLDPVVAERRRRIWEELEWRKCSKSWWYWLNTYVFTKDENDEKVPFKPFFSDGVLPYVFLLGQLYLHVRLLIVLKSRQMRVTWLFCALDLWTAMFKPGRFIPVTAYKELDAADLIDRMLFIYWGLGETTDPPDPSNPLDVASRGLPAWMRARSRIKHLKDPNQIEFLDNGSLVRALPDGSEIGRGKTISRWKNEESRSQPRLSDACQAIMPTIRNGNSQACFVSSAGPGYFQQLVEDKEDHGDAPPKPKRYNVKIPGIQIWRNARNGFTVVRLHYAADPKKTSERWLSRTKKGLRDHQWSMEFEIDFSARGGQPALSIFSTNYSKIVLPPRDLPLWWPRFASADYGVTNPYSCHFYAVAPDGTLFCYWEYYAPGPLGLHLSVIKAHPDWHLLSSLYILDKSAWAKTQQYSETVDGQTTHGVRSIAELHQKHGVNPIPATVTRDTVKVEALWDEWNRDDPRTVIFQTCPEMIRELPQIKWAEKKATAISEDEKLVDRDNHAFDDLSYAVLHYRQPGKNPEQAPQRSYEEEQKLATQTIVAEYRKRVDARVSGEAEYESHGVVDIDLD